MAVGFVSSFPHRNFFWDRSILPLGVHKDTLRDSLCQVAHGKRTCLLGS